MTISLFAHELDKYPKVMCCTWDELSSLLDHHEVKPTKDRLPCWSPTKFNGTRSKANAHEVWAFVIDFDKGVQPYTFKHKWSDYEFLAHSSFSHIPGHPKWRAIFPFEAPVPAEEWPRVWVNLGYHLANCKLDGSCADSSRIYFMPCCPAERMSDRFVWGHAGDFINPWAFPDVSEEQKAQLRDALTRDKSGRRLVGDFVDYEAIANASIPLSKRHEQLTRGIFKARKQGWDKEAIQIIITTFHDRETRGFGHRSKERSLEVYLSDIEHVWRTVTPDPRYTES